MMALHWISTRFDSLTFTSAPRWQQIDQATWANIRVLWSRSALPSLFPSWEVLVHQIRTTSPLWRAVGVAAARVEDTEGRHAGVGGAFVLFDESKAIADSYFDSALNMLSKSSVENKLVAIGTPGIPRGWFYSAFGSNRARWATLRGSALDVPELRDHALSERDRLGESNPFYRQQQLAEFSVADEFSIFNLADIEAATKRTFTDRDAPKIAALDPAGTGSDECALTFRQGRQQIALNCWQGMTEVASAKKAWDMAHSWGATEFYVDAPGIGGPFADMIETMARGAGDRCSVYRYQPGGSPRDAERFANAKAEDIYALADLFRSGQIGIIDDPTMIAQIASWRWATSQNFKTRVIDSESDSPDRADSLNISFAGPRAKGTVRTESPSWI